VRVFATSDLHLDYEENARWLSSISTAEYRNDLLILAGDISDSFELLAWCLRSLAVRFRRVLYVPGNHDLWVIRDKHRHTSLQKFQEICALAGDCDVSTEPFHIGRLSIVPLLAWYDYSFCSPTKGLDEVWMDYRACVWPSNLDAHEITKYFIRRNEQALKTRNHSIISFSHFVPRIDLLTWGRRLFYPVMGTALLEQQIRCLGPSIHIYGHSHINQHRAIGGISYINNAFGYPSETLISAKRLLCIHEI
jgi:predicted phosphodiesterase